MSGAQAPERIVEPRRIAHVLQQLRAKRSTLAARLHPGLAVSASTVILAVDTARAALVLDEFFPSTAQRAVAPGSAIDFSARLDGVAVQGSLRVRAIEPRPDGDLVWTELPHHLLWSQRRGAYRVPAVALPSSVALYDGERFRARILDLSLGGVGASIVTDKAFAPGGHAVWELQLLDAQLILSLVIRSAVRHAGAVRLGGELLDLTPAQRSAIQRAVTALQRAALRRERTLVHP